jgi:hypothetical protein
MRRTSEAEYQGDGVHVRQRRSKVLVSNSTEIQMALLAVLVVCLASAQSILADSCSAEVLAKKSACAVGTVGLSDGCAALIAAGSRASCA